MNTKGDISLLNEEKVRVAVIGSRNASQEGLISAYNIGRILALNNIVVVSGLALGVDTQAHLGCLSANGNTIAILPSGFNCIYPQDNKSLANNIVINNGLLLSEYSDDTKPTKYTFVQRDKVIAKCTMATIVVESEINSGTMHTVNFAKKFKKKIIVIDNNSAGNQSLINNDKSCIILQAPEASQKSHDDLLSLIETMKHTR